MSEFKTDKIIPVDAGSTTTIGCTGDTIATGAGTTLNIQGTYSGINSINWDTTAKTANFTAETNKGYFINTTSGSVTITLPATPVAGSFIGIKDYALTAQTNNILINPNGNKIQGNTNNFVINTQGGAANLVYVDSTQGWLTYDAGQASDITGPTYIVATGGTITCCGDYKIHTFTSPGTFTVSSIANPLGGPNNVDYLVIAGGGGGGSRRAGGGGAGGFRTSYPSPAGTIPVSASSYPISVGGGGAGGPTSGQGSSGSNSVFSSITSAGGGGGGYFPGPSGGTNGGSGGSGGGAGGGGGGGPPGSGGAGNTPPTTPPQGFPGGSPGSSKGGGGGGASQAGVVVPGPQSGPGGDGTANSITGSSVTRAGGGGGADEVCAGSGGAGGGGAGSVSSTGTAGTANTGGGGGAHGNTPANAPGGAGGSGIVIIRYKYQ